MSEVEGFESLDSAWDKCRECGARVSRRALHRQNHLKKHQVPIPHDRRIPKYDIGPPKEDPEADLGALLGNPVMSKDEAMKVASDLLRDPAVPANQKGPILSSMARVAGWETAPEYDFEKEREKWLKNFRKMLDAKAQVEGQLGALLKKHAAAIPAVEAILQKARVP